jgi:protein transport protein SEC23
MIQPALLEYSPEQPSAKGVALDERYMKLEVILLLDSFFNIVEWHGKNIESWL